nr:HIRA-interacting protein 3 [Parasteatoda tepidariorum]
MTAKTMVKAHILAHNNDVTNNNDVLCRFESSSDESEAPIAKKSKTKSDVKKVIQKSAPASSDSEDEPLASIKSNLENEEDSSLDENEEKPIANSKSKSSTKVNKAKEQKKQTPSSGKLENLKKYIRAAGIHIKSYDKLFENCKSMKSKSEKLLHLLEKEGLKGRPTLAKCKKLKKKIETKKEVAELDPSNIISSGRPKRTACFDTTNCIDDDDDSDVPLAKYSRLKGIIDSEDSD